MNNSNATPTLGWADRKSMIEGLLKELEHDTGHACHVPERVWDIVSDIHEGDVSPRDGEVYLGSYYLSVAGLTDPDPMTLEEIKWVVATMEKHMAAHGLKATTRIRIIAQGDKITFNVNAREVSDE